MKALCLIIAIVFAGFAQIKAQNPKLNFVGGSPSLSKGTIDTEVLTAIIQEKQEEIKLRVFKNTIIRQFKKKNKAVFKNFTTYHYLYELMETITSGKNKTAITKAIEARTTEFAYIYGLALYIEATAPYPQDDNKNNTASSYQDSTTKKFVGTANCINQITLKYETNSTDATLVTNPANQISYVNILVDACYDVILENEELQETFQFKQDKNDKNFMTWYKTDNVFLNTDDKDIKKIFKVNRDTLKEGIKAKLIDLQAKLIKLQDNLKKDTIDKAILDTVWTILKTREPEIASLKLPLLNDLFESKDISSLLKKLKESKNIVLNLINSDGIIKELNKELSSNEKSQEIMAKLKEVIIKKGITNLDSVIKSTFKEFDITDEKAINNITKILSKDITEPNNLPKQWQKLESLITIINREYHTLTALFNFYQGLEKSEFKDFSLTKDQYEAMKYILVNFIKLVRNHSDADVSSSLLDFLLENTIIEYADNKESNVGAKKDTTKGYLYVDIESLVLAIDQKFSAITHRTVTVYLSPFFTIGANHAVAFRSNQLLSKDGQTSSLSNIHFAGEKLGLRFKIHNWKYTHAFKVGQIYTYYCSNDRVWLSPPKEPFFSDVHFDVYASGLLYNLVNLKSEAQFNYALAGANLGLTFFNGLELNMGLACPFTDNKFDLNKNLLFTLGFDIPIIEYITAVAKKRK